VTDSPRYSPIARALAALFLVAGWAPAQTPRVNVGAAADVLRKNVPGRAAPTVRLQAAGSRDQDDMCIWVHPSDASKSTVVTSDKSGGRLFVYDLAGRAIQSLPAGKPGNIDVRYGFPLAGKKVDVVAFNQRDDDEIWVHAVHPATRTLRRVDDGRIRTAMNYGGTLFRSPRTGKLYFVTTAIRTEQYELSDDGSGKVAGRKVRSWRTGLCEGAVGDDEAGVVYVAQENRGVWAVGGEPTDPPPGKLVIRTGENGLEPDVEGLAIYRTSARGGYLLVSSQGIHAFKVYQRGGAHRFLGTFTVRGARDTDGIDVTNVALSAAFPKGLFACHTDSGGRPVLLTPWERIAKAIAPPLKIDTTWRPRKPR
jgi:3-phytase